MNTLRKHAIAVSLIGAVAILAAVGIFASRPAHANPTYLAPTVQTNAATSSVSFLTPGTGTTTLAYDAFVNPTTNHYKADKASLLVQFVGSTTSSVLAVNFEYSNDGVDWYKSYLTDAIGTSTTSPTFSVGNPNKISWTFASSTLGGAAASSTNSATSTAIFSVPTPVRYVRAIFTITGANGAVWAQFVPIKEQL